MIKNSSTYQEIFLTANEAAHLLHISLSTLKKLIYGGKVTTFVTPGGHHRIPRSSLYELLRAPTRPRARRDSRRSLEVLEDMVRTLEARTRFHQGHSIEVERVSAALAKRLQLPASAVHKIRTASLLHDIGLIGIHEGVINKPSPLTGEEMRLVRSHPLAGETMVTLIRNLNGASLVVRQHHERLDGSGYPDGLKGEEICLEARIIAVAEAFVGMTSGGYKPAMDIDTALQEMRDAAGVLFDRAAIDALCVLYAK